jgi:hypothetical protein
MSLSSFNLSLTNTRWNQKGTALTPALSINVSHDFVSSWHPSCQKSETAQAVEITAPPIR